MMERICPFCRNKINQYPPIQKCGKCLEIIIPDGYMYSLLNQQQNSCGISCSWDENDENNIVNEYLNKYSIDTNLINNIIKSNLFVLLSNETILEYFTLTKKKYRSNIEIKNELISKLRNIATPYSSNVLTFNIFEYWRQKNEICKITAALEIYCFNSPTMCFEKSFEIDKNKSIDPHLDIYFEDTLKDNGAGVECKFGESFNRNFPIIKWEGFCDYLKNDEIWRKLTNLKKYATKLYSERRQNKYFNVKQSICHILSLHKYFCENVNKYYFVYLYYPSLFKNENLDYINEIDEFSKCLKDDGVNFIYKTYDQLMETLSKETKVEDESYFTYNKNRYFLLKEYFMEIVKNF